MKRLMAYVLTFGLVLLGTSPVLAAGAQAKAGVPALRGANQSEALQVVVPKGKSLEEADLEETTGEVAPEVIGVVVGAIVGVVAGHRDAGWKGALVGAFIGAAAGFMSTAVGPASGALIEEVGRRIVYSPIVHGK